MVDEARREHVGPRGGSGALDDAQRCRVEFWFEFGSTYSYPAAFRVEEATGNAGVELLSRSR